MYWNERARQLVRVRCGEDRSHFLRLDMNENPEGLPEDIVGRIRERIDGQLLAAYPDKAPLTERIAERENLSTENVAITNGSDEGIRSIFEAFTRPGSRALMVSPSFEMYRVYSVLFGVELEQVPYQEDLTLPLERLKSRITGETDLLVLFNPNSPIGDSYTREEMEELLDACRETGTLAVVDEAYYPFGVSSAASLIGAYPGLIVLRTFSKLYSIAGLRVGYALGGRQLIQCLDHVLATYNANAVGLLAAEELLKRPGLEKEMLAREAEGRAFLQKRLEEAGYRYFAKGGNYVLIQTRKAPQTVADRLRDRKILIKAYAGGILQDWIRVTTGSRAVMERFWREFCECDA